MEAVVLQLPENQKQYLIAAEALAGVTRAIERRLNQPLAKAGVSRTGFAILEAIGDEAKRQTEVWAIVGCSKANLTEVLQTLRVAGYVYSRRLPHDRRSAELSLTRSGRQVLREALVCRDEVAAEFFYHLDANELDQLTALLLQLTG